MRSCPPRRSLLVVVVIAIMVAVIGCGTESERDSTREDSREATTPTSSELEEASPRVGSEEPQSAPATDPRARKTLRSALLRLLHANTGHFELDIPSGSGSGIRERGRYQISPVAYDVVRELTLSDVSLRMAYRGVGSKMWYRLESVTTDDDGSQSWPCWVNYEDVASLDEFPTELTQGLAGQPPAALVAATYGVGKQRIDRDSIAGTTDLALTLGLFGNKFVTASGVDVQGDDTVPATFSLEKRTLTGFSVAVADLPAAIESAGVDLPQEFESLDVVPDRITVRFSDSGVPVDVKAPPADERLTFESTDNFRSAMRSCGGR